MSNTLKKYGLLFLMTFASSIISCIPNCPDSLPFFQIENFLAENHKFTNNKDVDTNIDLGEEVIWDKYYIQFVFEGFRYAENKNNSGGSLLATSCYEDRGLGSEIGLDTLYLVSINNYNESHAANDTINEIIMVNTLVYNSSKWENFMTLEEYVGYNKSRVFSEYFYIKLAKSPTSELSEQQFKIIYHLTSGEVMETLSPKVLLKKN